MIGKERKRRIKERGSLDDDLLDVKQSEKGQHDVLVFSTSSLQLKGVEPFREMVFQRSFNNERVKGTRSNM